MVNAISEALARKMQSEGLELPTGEIYNEDSVSLKDAIVSLDFGCTGSMISPRGLLITNHHCAYSDVHSISTIEHNYLESGFVADVPSEEKYIPGKKAYFLRRVLDVTDEVNSLMEEERAAGRATGFRRISFLFEKRYAAASGHEASLSSMWAGSRYYLALYDVYSDIRLVVAPPVSISAFGGDEDNWEWPQHKCDFAMYRIYADKDGNPAGYSPDNIPLTPRNFLKISTEGVSAGDFAMILGYPGTTKRYSPSAEVRYRREVALPITNELRHGRMEIMREWMKRDSEVRLKYSNKFFSLSNVQENNEGLQDCIDRFGVIEKIEQSEKPMKKSRDGRKLLKDLKTQYKAIEKAERNLIYYRETLIRGSELATIALRLKNIKSLDIRKQYEGIDLRVERDLLRYSVGEFYKNVDRDLWGPLQRELYESCGGDAEKVCDAIWLDAPMTKESLIYRFFTEVSIGDLNKAVSEAQDGLKDDHNTLRRQYVKAKYSLYSEDESLLYPDANSTMRLTYGTVRSFERDGETLPCNTHISEILQKEDPWDYDFTLLPEWRQTLRESLSKGRDIPVNFISNNDITGGNSGSPVLNARGELVGLAFDGNKESLAGDLFFVEDYNRCVSVDIRYVLFALEHYAKAYNILREINLPSKMENPLLTPSPLPYGAPQFDLIKTEHYLPAFKEAITEAKKEIDAIANNPAKATFENSVEALEYAGETLTRVSSIFYNLLESNADEKMQEEAEKISPLMTEYSMYVSLNEKLFERIKSVWEERASLNLSRDQLKLLEESYKSFVRSGANLSGEDKALYSKYMEELSLLTLRFSRNLLASTNAFTLNLNSEDELDGLPDYVREMGASAAKEKGANGWLFDLSYPSYSAFMQFSARSDLRKHLYLAYNSRAFGGENDNSEVCRRVAELRFEVAKLLGYRNYADYVLSDRMAGNVGAVTSLLNELMEPSLPAAKKEVKQVYDYALRHGYKAARMEPWDFSYWSEKYKSEYYSLSDEQLKPYFKLENCIDAVFSLAGRLYGISFTPMPELPVYNKDVRVYDVKDSAGRHLALFYADFFPRETKRGGAWMSGIVEQSKRGGVERRPIVSIVTNFTKPTGDSPSLLTHYELTTFLHEFGHALHGMLTEGTYPSLSGTNVAWDFVELPSQIMENYACEPEYLRSFARHNKTGEVIPDELIESISKAKNYHAAYAQVRQLQFGLLDMAWYNVEKPFEGSVPELENKALSPYRTLPKVDGCCTSTSFSHIFSGGYAAGYYSYKWAEVLEADAWSLFKEKGIFNTEVSGSFRENILSKGSSEDEAVMYRNFRGHDPEPRALLDKLGISHK